MPAAKEKPSQMSAAHWDNSERTKAWLEENKIFIGRPVRDLDAHFLADAAAHCTSYDNPYMREILVRGRKLDEYLQADNAIDKSRIAQQAGDVLGVIIF